MLVISFYTADFFILDRSWTTFKPYKLLPITSAILYRENIYSLNGPTLNQM